MAKSDHSHSPGSQPRDNETEEQNLTNDMVVKSGEPFRLLVESVKDYAIFMIDPRGYIESWNLGAENLLT